MVARPGCPEQAACGLLSTGKTRCAELLGVNRVMPESEVRFSGPVGVDEGKDLENGPLPHVAHERAAEQSEVDRAISPQAGTRTSRLALPTTSNSPPQSPHSPPETGRRGTLTGRRALLNHGPPWRKSDRTRDIVHHSLNRAASRQRTDDGRRCDGVRLRRVRVVVVRGGVAPMIEMTEALAICGGTSVSCSWPANAAGSDASNLLCVE